MQYIRHSCSFGETTPESLRFILGKSDFHPCSLGVSKEVSKNKGYFKEEKIDR